MRIGSLLAALACLVCAQGPCGATTQDALPAPGSHRYFIDFRARVTPPPTGHTYVVYWSEHADGSVDEIYYDGLHPDGAAPTWIAGVVLPVPATESTIRRDVEERPVSGYLIELSGQQFADVKSRVAALHRANPYWNLIVFNCNAFAGEIARTLGLNVPPTHLLWPAIYVLTLRAMNE